MNINDLLEQGANMAIQEMEEAKEERASVPASNNAEDMQTNEQTDVQTQGTEREEQDTEQAQEEKSLSKVERLLMEAMEEMDKDDVQTEDVQTDQAQDVQDSDDSEDIEEEDEQAQESDTATDEDDTDERANESEDTDEITQLVHALEEERTKIEQERKEFQKQIERMEKERDKAIKAQKQAEQNAIKTAISYDLVNRDDVKDPRLLFQIIDTSDIDTTKDINDQVTVKINKVMKKFPSLSTETIPKQIKTNNKDGMTVIDEVRPIGKPMGQKQIPKVTPAKMVKQLKDRAKREGTPQARADYLAKKRELQKKGYRF